MGIQVEESCGKKQQNNVRRIQTESVPNSKESHEKTELWHWAVENATVND